METKKINTKKVLSLSVMVIVIGVVVALLGGAVGKVDSPEYKVKQSIVSGELSAKMNPGVYMKNYGKIYDFPKVESVYFGAEERVTEGISVIFSDNSRCTVSGSVRIAMPISEDQAIAIVAKHSNRSFADFESKNIRPQIRSSLITAASLMPASEGKLRMADLANMAQDQLNNGTYLMETQYEKSMLEGEERQIKKTIKVDTNGNFMRYLDNIPMKDFGVNATNFVISDIKCDDQIEAQIQAIRDNRLMQENEESRMALAEQRMLTALKEGDARIAQIQKEEEALSQKLIVEADRNKQIAIKEAEMGVEVARLNVAEEETRLKAADIQAQIVRVQADAEAYAKAKAVSADNNLQVKLTTYQNTVTAIAEALSKVKFSEVYISGSGDAAGSSQAQEYMNFMNLLSAKVAKDMSVDLTVK
jgi:hypothetical protein